MPIQDEIRKYFFSLLVGPGEHGLLEMIGEVRRQGLDLLGQTSALFWTEMREKVRLLTKDTIIIILGGTFLWVGLLAFVATSILVLSYLVPLWLAALIVSIFFGFFGTVLVLTGIALFRRRTITPHLTVQALRDNARWLRGEMELADRTGG